MSSISRMVWRASVCSVALLATSGAWAHDDDDDDNHGGKTTRHMTGSLDICDFGAFFVGGVPKLTQYANSAATATATTPWQQLVIGQIRRGIDAHGWGLRL